MFALPSIIFAFVMGFFMSLTVTFATTLIQTGMSEDFFKAWGAAWVLGYPIVVGCIIFYRPLAMKITGRVANWIARIKAARNSSES